MSQLLRESAIAIRVIREKTVEEEEINHSEHASSIGDKVAIMRQRYTIDMRISNRGKGGS